MNRFGHLVKISDKFFNDVVNGDKTFEVRRNDRSYKIGDILFMNEVVIIDSNIEIETGRQVSALITYIHDDNKYVLDGFVILGINVDF